jgi:hypothetical protein
MRLARTTAVLLAALVLLAPARSMQAAPLGQLARGAHIALAPTGLACDVGAAYGAEYRDKTSRGILYTGSVDNHGLITLTGFAYSAPYEDLTLRTK